MQKAEVNMCQGLVSWLWIEESDKSFSKDGKDGKDDTNTIWLQNGCGTLRW
jgi:hypothetical protein